ncbi:hypothetical protein QUC31_014218 [Theobroma cacao]|uniref:Heme-binding protein 2 n=2 Tax=Theobroma cacao TaxID=3641 RepID=A0AB32VLS9_THECC|nr:PREDICTED: heme-binding protein 2 [Theobroma cacao]EOY00567.1 SOUL heme-binding family protein, putative [Theobroma cacao]WRX14758.1 SOUL hem-binding protein - like 1 [Theobroma cacao]WRX16618.1 SOUL hem-binding protein - like 2 [Theobroma cacao]
MEKLFLLIVTMTAAVSYPSAKCFVLISAYTIESPQFRVVHLESDFEVRLYEEMSWMSALVYGTSFENSTRDGFHRLYQYIHGDNLNATQFLMTAPVLTSVTPSAHGSAYIVRYYLPPTFDQTSPPQPSAELNLQLDKWESHCIAVRMFPGYARDDNVDKEKDALLSSLGKHLPGLKQAAENNYNYSIAQYNASKHPTGRINEVWMDVSGFAAEGCPV